MAALSIGQLVGTIELDVSPFERSLDAAQSALDGGMSKWVGIAGAAGLALAAAFGSTLLEGMDVQQANAKLKAQLGLTESESKRIGGAAGKLYASAYGDNLGEVNDAVASVIQNIDGMRTASSSSLEKITGRVMSVADAFDQDLGGVTQAVGQMMRTGLAKNATEALDLITVGMQNGVNKADDLLETVNEYSTVWRDAGLSGKDAMGLMSQGLKGGARDADTVADSLKEFAIRAQDGSKTSAAGFEAIGLNAAKMTAAVAKGGPGARAALDSVLDGLRDVKDPAERNAAAVALFGTKAEDMGDALFKLDLDTAAQGLGKVGGAAARVDKTMGNTAKGNLTAFTRTIKTGLVNVLGGRAVPAVTALAGALNNALGPALRGVMSAISSTVGWFRQHETTAKVLAGVLATVLGPAMLVVGVRATVAAAQLVASWIAASAGAVASAAMHAVSLTAMGVAWIRAGAQAVASAVRMAGAWLIAMGPIGLAIAAIAGAVFLVVKYWDKIKAATVTAWKAVGAALSAAWAWIKNLFTSVMGAIGAAVRAYFTAYRTAVSTAFNAVKSVVSNAWNAVKSTTTSALSAVVGFVKALPGRVVSALSALGSRVASAARTGFGWLRTAASEKVETLLTFVKDLPARVVRGLGRIGTLLYNAGKDLVQGMINGLKDMAGKLASAAKDMAGNAVKSVKNALGIASPSKVFRKLFRWVGIGAADGLSSTTPMVAARAADLAAAATREAQAGLTAAAVGTLRPAGAAAPTAAGGERVIERVVIERGPLFGDVYQQPGESTEQLAERLWALTKARG